MAPKKSDSRVPSTYFASAERASDEEIRELHGKFCREASAVTLLEAFPGPAMVLNEHRQIVVANRVLLDALGAGDPAELLGRRPGEALGCVHSDEMPGGCGTSRACSVCGAVKAIVGCLDCKGMVEEECRISTKSGADGGALDASVHAAWLSLPSGCYLFVTLRDISAEKRRGVLERVFFHDVLNTASGIRAIAELMRDHPEIIFARQERYGGDLDRMSEQIVDEIVGQRQLLAAEQGQLLLRPSTTAVGELLDEVRSLYQYHGAARDRTISIEHAADCAIVIDRMLLRRSLGNLLKNALEATEPGDIVTIRADEIEGSIRFTVANPGVMDESVQQQIFQRSFSTKDGFGRGIGVYSVRLFVERYLRGTVAFTSREGEGTSFAITIPKS